MGGYFAYGSYRSKSQPMAANTLIIVLSNLVVSVAHACFAFTALNYLRTMEDAATFQYGNTGLNFIAIPRLTYYMGSEGQLWLRLYMVYLYLLAIDTSYGFIEGLVINIVEHTGMPRIGVAFGVNALGAGITILFCSNIGWILVDATEHFLYYVMIPIIGLLECVLVGWQMGPPTPAKRAARVLGLVYWVPLVISALVFAYAFNEYRFWAPVPVIVCTLMGLFLSKCCGRMPLKMWYEQVVLAGIYELTKAPASHPGPRDDPNSMRPDRNGLASALLKSYAGLLIKFVLPAGFIFNLAFNLEQDGSENYNGIDSELLLCGAGFTLIALLFLVMPLCCCDDDDRLDENVIDKEIAEATEMQAMHEARMQAEKERAAAAMPNREDDGDIAMAHLDKPG